MTVYTHAYRVHACVCVCVCARAHDKHVSDYEDTLSASHLHLGLAPANSVLKCILQVVTEGLDNVTVSCLKYAKVPQNCQETAGRWVIGAPCDLPWGTIRDRKEMR